MVPFSADMLIFCWGIENKIAHWQAHLTGWKIPICSMHGIFYIHFGHEFVANVGKYSIHWASGMWINLCFHIPISMIHYWVVALKIFYLPPYLGKIPILTNIFQMGWNHQPGFFHIQILMIHYYGVYSRLVNALSSQGSLNPPPLEIKNCNPWWYKTWHCCFLSPNDVVSHEFVSTCSKVFQMRLWFWRVFFCFHFNSCI